MSNGFLSQDEINSLIHGDDSLDTTTENETKSEELNDIEKDLLGEIGNISMGSASTALNQLINQTVDITTPVVSLTTLKEVKESFDTPNIVLDVKYVSGIVGRNILIMKNKDAAVIASLMMGGDGEVKDEVEDLSEIEISAVQEAMNQMIGSAATAMATMLAREVNISPPNSKVWKDDEDTITDTLSEDETIVRVNFKMKIGDLVDSNIMQVLPFETAKRIVKIMMGEDNTAPSEEPSNENIPEMFTKPIEEPEQTAQQSNPQTVQYSEPQYNSEPQYSAPQQSTQSRPVEVHNASFQSLGGSGSVQGDMPRNIDLIMDVPLDISVVLGRSRKSIKEILDLATGSLIELDKLAEEPVEILVNGKKIAYGEVVVVDENFGVRITNIISSAERIESLRK